MSCVRFQHGSDELTSIVFPSSSGQDAGFSSREPEFESPWECQSESARRTIDSVRAHLSSLR